MININKENFINNFIKFPKKNLLLILFLFGFGEWFVSDVINFSGGSIGFILLCGIGYFYLKNDQPKFNEPRDLKGWINLCNEDLDFFNELEETNNFEKKNFIRKTTFNEILGNVDKPRILMIGDTEVVSNQLFLERFLPEKKFKLVKYGELPTCQSQEAIPNTFIKNDAIIFNLSIPMTAKDFLWLQKLPEKMPVWLFLAHSNNNWDRDQFDEFKLQIPDKYINNIITSNTEHKESFEIPFSFRKFLVNPSKNIEQTKLRLLRDLHITWQGEIEAIRRVQLKEIQRKNQILIATTVFASPIPSLDVLSMTILNSLMINEIKTIWRCNWSPELLETVSKQIIKTAIAQGAIEWSSQTLLGISKIHAPNWLVAGTFQAISAAYLTRVVSRSLADFMAVSKGVSEPSLEYIKKNSEQIVENAFESEKINWKEIITDLKRPLGIQNS